MGKGMDIVGAYKEGASLRSISRVTGYSPSTVAVILREHGVKVRPRGRPRKVIAGAGLHDVRSS